MIESLTESDSAEQGRIFDLLVADPTQQESFSEAFLTVRLEISILTCAHHIPFRNSQSSVLPPIFSVCPLFAKD
jgi:hypothetical protein